METKILYPYANVMGIFFPVGDLKNGGTCQFSTAMCKKKCCANREGVKSIIGVKNKKPIFDFFEKENFYTIVGQILKELEQNNCKILTWFSSGDCPAPLTKKFAQIVLELDKNEIVQTGVTRNKELWKLVKSNKSKSKVLLTLEKIPTELEEGLYSIPNYALGTIDVLIVKNQRKYIRYGCGGSYYEDHIKKEKLECNHLKLDCKYCFENNTGCFTKF